MWPEAEDKKARQNLNDAFWSLRKGLREAQATEAIMACLERAGDGAVGFDRNCDYSCDAEEFERLVSNATSGTDLQALEKAFHLYRGPFLENFSVQAAPEFDAWVEVERRTLAGAYHKLLHLLIRHYLADGNWLAAIECLQHLWADILEEQQAEEAQAKAGKDVSFQ
jgi:DNA-binding SARP family transcriptional activator